ncbi:uncharacterized protein LOC112046691 isoform X2 [Bicyclus anynana]|uniref:Uncharacterized protein LOC112046691 isoform X2 n=1 Tax=Bicyclus anynana TaxID=110368 RepID=A0A6J1N817_BICAN|nr:uncharacterized protein LOC112046691 isoform X2 [Bicyclus anynana]
MFSPCEDSQLSKELATFCEEMELNSALVELCIQAEKEQAIFSNQSGGGLKRRVTDTIQPPSKRPCNQKPSTSADASRSSNGGEECSNSINPNNSIECPGCKIYVSRRYFHNHLRSKLHINNVLKSSVENLYNVRLIENAFGQRIATYRISNYPNSNVFGNQEFETPEYFLNTNKEIITELIYKLLKVHNSIKINFTLNGDFIQQSKDLENNFDFQTSNFVFCIGNEFNNILSEIFEHISIKVSNFEKRDSGWSLKKNNYLDLNINKFSPLRGSSFIDLPQDIKNKNAVINVKNNDYQCFQWAIISALYPVKANVDRVSSYSSKANT